MLRQFKTEPAPGGIYVTVGKNTLFFPAVDQSQMNYSLNQYLWGNNNVQDAFSFLDADQREFLMTGLLPDEWDELFEED